MHLPRPLVTLDNFIYRIFGLFSSIILYNILVSFYFERTGLIVFISR